MVGLPVAERCPIYIGRFLRPAEHVRAGVGDQGGNRILVEEVTGADRIRARDIAGDHRDVVLLDQLSGLGEGDVRCSLLVLEE